MIEGVLIGVISMLTVVTVYFWVVKRASEDPSQQAAQK
jgi:hypothetical protein